MIEGKSRLRKLTPDQISSHERNLQNEVEDQINNKQEESLTSLSPINEIEDFEANEDIQDFEANEPIQDIEASVPFQDFGTNGFYEPNAVFEDIESKEEDDTDPYEESPIVPDLPEIIPPPPPPPPPFFLIRRPRRDRPARNGRERHMCIRVWGSTKSAGVH